MPEQDSMPRCEKVFLQSIKSEYTRRDYVLGLKYFREFLGLGKIEELLEGDQKAIQEKVEDYLFHLKGRTNPNTIPTRMYPVFLFKTLNSFG